MLTEYMVGITYTGVVKLHCILPLRRIEGSILQHSNPSAKIEIREQRYIMIKLLELPIHNPFKLLMPQFSIDENVSPNLL